VEPLTLHPAHLLRTHHTPLLRLAFGSAIALAWILDRAHHLSHDPTALLCHMGTLLASFIIGSAILSEGIPPSALHYLHATNLFIFAARLHSLHSKWADFQLHRWAWLDEDSPPLLLPSSITHSALFIDARPTNDTLAADSLPPGEPSVDVAVGPEVAAIRFAGICATALGALGRAAISSYGQGIHFWSSARMLAVFNALVLLTTVGLLWWHDAPPTYPPTDGPMAEPLLLAGWLLLLAIVFGPRTRRRVARLLGLRPAHALRAGFDAA